MLKISWLDTPQTVTIEKVSDSSLDIVLEDGSKATVSDKYIESIKKEGVSR